MNMITSWSDLVTACRAIGVDTEPLGCKIRLNCALNGNGLTLFLKDACEAFLLAEYHLVVPLGEFSFNIGGTPRLKSAYEIADLSGIEFGIALMADRGVGVTLQGFQQRYRHLESLKSGAFHTRARRFGDLMWEVPSGLRLFKSYYIQEGPNAGQQGYRRRAGRTCMLVVEPARGHTWSDEVSTVFRLLARSCLQEAVQCHGSASNAQPTWLHVLQIPASEERPPNRRAQSAKNGMIESAVSEEKKGRRRGRPVKRRRPTKPELRNLTFAIDSSVEDYSEDE